jgi:hypothetical protein
MRRLRKRWIRPQGLTLAKLRVLGPHASHLLNVTATVTRRRYAPNFRERPFLLLGTAPEKRMAPVQYPRRSRHRTGATLALVQPHPAPGLPPGRRIGGLERILARFVNKCG